MDVSVTVAVIVLIRIDGAVTEDVLSSTVCVRCMTSGSSLGGGGPRTEIGLDSTCSEPSFLFLTFPDPFSKLPFSLRVTVSLNLIKASSLPVSPLC